MSSVPRLFLVILMALGTALADPLRPEPAAPTVREPAPAPQPPPEPTLSLTSIYILDQQRYAIVNGQWLAPDDAIANYRVVDITADRVVLRRDGRTRTLTPENAGRLTITPTDSEKE